MVGYVAFRIIHRIHMIIAHVKVSTGIILRNPGIDIVRWENINLSIVNMGPWIRRIDTFY